MTIRVLVVDDSGFFRRRLTEILGSDPMIEVVDTAVDGKDALAKVAVCKPDVITMDIEMPVMNGIEATRKIMQLRPTPILMFSSLTYDGAQATLDALEAGATDFIPKRFDDISNDKDEARRILCSRVKSLAQPGVSRAPAASRIPAAPSAAPVARPPQPALRDAVKPAVAAPAEAARQPGKKFNPADFDVVAIGTSTGGPVALQTVLTQLPKDFPLPVLLVQHMPAAFTQAFANRLNQLCKIGVQEAKDGDFLQPGIALLAPGGMQMKVTRRGPRMQVTVTPETNPAQNYKPCVDVTFESLASSVGGRVLGVILTGMGADGREGCNKLKSRGATIWAQDEATSTIYGMPAAVANIAEQILPLADIAKKLGLNS
ncbi:MAG: two-component system, chemotaxis family, protein-glutamate methylesterase/glutaminase [Pseudomonadota bacterium]|nr:two-component system, chemotaxis family, protein-glutamate methylesterase/glutaminase [Pseudomonadota bacterium]